MSKSDTSDVKSRIKQNITDVKSQGASNAEQIQGALGTAQQTSASILPSVVGGYSDISSTGGYDPSILGSIRSGYSDLATTGGVSPEAVQAMKSEASASARSVFDSLGARAKRLSTTTGGYGSPAAALTSMGRQASQESAKATSDVNAKIAAMQQSGRIAGLGGLGATEQGVTAGRLGGLGGLTNIYGTSTQQASTAINQLLQNFSTTGQLTQSDLELLAQIASKPGLGSSILGGITGLAGAGAGVLSAVAPKGLVGGS